MPDEKPITDAPKPEAAAATTNAVAPSASSVPTAPKPAGPPPMPKPPPLIPFVLLPDRVKVDHGEHAAEGSRPIGSDREWIGYNQQGGGKVPDDWFWGGSPKQVQDEEM